jgi:UPF0755 protein
MAGRGPEGAVSYGGSELSTFFGSGYDEPPTRAERRRQQHRRRRRRRRGPFAMLLAVLVIGALVAGILYGGRIVKEKFGSVPDYPGAGTGSVTIEVNRGDTASDIAVTLTKADVVKSERAFRDAAKADPRSTGIQPGYYRMHRQMSGAAALALLLDPHSRLLSRVTVQEGLTVAEILKLLAAKTGRSLASLQAAARDTSLLGLPGYAHGKLEGFLFPATYDVDPGMSAADVLRQMVATYRDRVDEATITAGARALGITPYQVLVVASMVEREAKVAEDRGKIARVIYNRLGDDMFLGVDATVLYGLGRTHGALTATDLAKRTPYNTYLIKGLPPTPIANPGKAAIDAALHPTPGNWLYYVLADRSGRHFFTADRDAFNAAVARCRAAGLC